MHLRKEDFVFVIDPCKENRAANKNDRTKLWLQGQYGNKSNDMLTKIKTAIQHDTYI